MKAAKWTLYVIEVKHNPAWKPNTAEEAMRCGLERLITELQQLDPTSQYYTAKYIRED
jgi:hypothetical protein